VQYIVLYIVTLILFVIADALGLTFILKPLFEANVADLMAPDLLPIPAVAFYLSYVLGLLIFASGPALRARKPFDALWKGGLFGTFCYGTYELTNMATLRGWSWEQVQTDILWGAAVSAGAAFAGLMIARGFGRR